MTQHQQQNKLRPSAQWHTYFRTGTELDTHTYLQHKGLDTSQGIRLCQEAGARIRYKNGNPELIIPIASDFNGKTITGGQRILEDGQKRMISTTKLKDVEDNQAFITVNKNAQKDVIYLVEGLADALTTAIATGKMAVASLSVGTLQETAKAIRKLEPTAKIIIVPDNDKAGKDVGRKTARATRQNVSNVIIHWLPEGYKDIDEIRMKDGIDEVRAILAKEPTEPSGNIEITPQRITNQFFPTGLITNSTSQVLFIESPQGSGKTTAVYEANQNNDSFISIANTQLLSREQSHKGDMDCYLDVSSFSKKDRLAVCIGSIYKTELANTIHIDEADQTFNALCDSTYLKNTDRAVERLRDAVRAGKRFVFTSADLPLWKVKQICKVIGIKTTDVSYIVNDYKKARASYKLGKVSDVYDRLVEGLGAGKRFAVATDSRRSADDLKQLVEGNFINKKILLVTGRTSGERQVIDYVKAPGESQVEYDVLIYTTSMGSGIDIPAGTYDEVLGVFNNGNLSGAVSAQMLLRLRGDAPVYFTAGTGKAEDPQEFEERHKKKHAKEQSLVRSPARAWKDARVREYILTNRVMEQKELPRIADPLYKPTGIHAQVIPSNYDGASDLEYRKDIREQTIAARVDTLCQTTDITEQVAFDIRMKRTRTSEESDQLFLFDIWRDMTNGKRPEYYRDVIELCVRVERTRKTYKVANWSIEKREEEHNKNLFSGIHELNQTYPALTSWTCITPFVIARYIMEMGSVDKQDGFIKDIVRQQHAAGITTANYDGRPFAFITKYLATIGVYLVVINKHGEHGRVYAIDTERTELAMKIARTRLEVNSADMLGVILTSRININNAQKDGKPKAKVILTALFKKLEQDYKPPPSFDPPPSRD